MREGTCIHFCGILKPCDKALIPTLERDGGRILRRPCIERFREINAETPEDALPCDLLELPTAEQIAAHDAETEILMQQMIARMEKLEPLIRKIKQENKRKNAAGKEPCPACETGDLHWGHAGINGHIRMRCTTEDCITFME